MQNFSFLALKRRVKLEVTHGRHAKNSSRNVKTKKFGKCSRGNLIWEKLGMPIATTFFSKLGPKQWGWVLLFTFSSFSSGTSFTYTFSWCHVRWIGSRMWESFWAKWTLEGFITRMDSGVFLKNNKCRTRRKESVRSWLIFTPWITQAYELLQDTIS